MAYNEELAALVRKSISGVKGVTEKKMFGGIAFMANARMLIGVDKNDLIIRCEKDETDVLLKKKGVRVFDLSGGRPMKGWLLVGPEATNTAKGLSDWVEFAIAGNKKVGKKK